MFVCDATGCGGNFTTMNGVIMSKNYPNNYPHSTECEWLIQLPDNHPVVINFTDFDVEGGYCSFDYVAVSSFLNLFFYLHGYCFSHHQQEYVIIFIITT